MFLASLLYSQAEEKYLTGRGGVFVSSICFPIQWFVRKLVHANWCTNPVSSVDVDSGHSTHKIIYMGLCVVFEDCLVISGEM